MSGFSDIKKGLSRMEALERELHLKQLQINRLLNITQAINNNVSAEGLFEMYKSFLSWEIGVKKMALFVKDDQGWSCATSIGLSEIPTDLNIESYSGIFNRVKNLEGSDHPFVKEFDVIIPVRHKEQPIAYVLVGGFSEDEDRYNKVQFATTITNIIAVAIENKRLFKRQLEQERLKREMELASEMQRLLIPKQLPKKKAYELASIYKPYSGVGGDYFDVIEFDDGRFAFCIGDISGKGVAAALLMANFQSNFQMLVNRKENLDQFIRDLNCSVHRITEGDRFITFFIAEFDIARRQLKYVNAGHNPPFLIMNDRVHQLSTGCTILGSFKELPKVEIGTLNLREEAMILAFTDGLTDLKNENGEFLNEQLLNHLIRDHYYLSAADFNRLLMERIETFKGDQQYPDDFTVLTCKIF